MAAHINITTQALPDAPPTVTPYQQLAAEAITALDQILAVIPKLEEAEASGRKVANSRLAVPDAFIATVISAVEQQPDLAVTKKLDPVAARDKVLYLEAFRPLYDKVATVFKRLGYGLKVNKDSLGAETLQVYRIARQLASDRRSPQMAAHVENMKRALGIRGLTKAEREKRKAAKQEVQKVA